MAADDEATGADPDTGRVGGERTIEELAAASGLPVSTIRMYQHRRLLPPPEKRGRVGIYDEGHLRRLRLIGELQDRGYSLAAIGDLVEGWSEGRSLTDVLGLSTAGAWGADRPLVLTPAELADRFPPGVITPETLQRAVAAGLGRLTDDGRVEVLDEGYLEVGVGVAELGIPPAAFFDEWERLQATTDDLAHRFAELFRTHLWTGFEADGLPAERVPEVVSALERLGPLAEAAIALAFRRSVRAEAVRFLGEQAEALGVAPPP